MGENAKDLTKRGYCLSSLYGDDWNTWQSLSPCVLSTGMINQSEQCGVKEVKLAIGGLTKRIRRYREEYF